MMVPAKWLLFAADLLDRASADFSNHGCNDLDYPSGWTRKDIREFERACEEWNTEGRSDRPEAATPDWMAMAFLSHVLRQEAVRVARAARIAGGFSEDRGGV